MSYTRLFEVLLMQKHHRTNCSINLKPQVLKKIQKIASENEWNLSRTIEYLTKNGLIHQYQNKVKPKPQQRNVGLTITTEIQLKLSEYRHLQFKNKSAYWRELINIGIKHTQKGKDANEKEPQPLQLSLF
nr:hypothetical protein [Thiotrichaceae bacterium]